MQSKCSATRGLREKHAAGSTDCIEVIPERHRSSHKSSGIAKVEMGVCARRLINGTCPLRVALHGKPKRHARCELRGMLTLQSAS